MSPGRCRCSGLELVADGLTKPLQGQAFTHFLGLIRMMENEPEVNISKAVGLPTSALTNALRASQSD